MPRMPGTEDDVPPDLMTQAEAGEVDLRKAAAALVTEDAIYLTGSEKDSEQVGVFVTAGDVRRLRAALATQPATSQEGEVKAWLYQREGCTSVVAKNAHRWANTDGWVETPLIAALATQPDDRN